MPLTRPSPPDRAGEIPAWQKEFEERYGKSPKLDHVKYVKRGAKIYPYFNTGQKRDGKVIYQPLPSPSAPEFFTVYAAMKAARTKRAKVEYTVEKMGDDYLLSKAIWARARPQELMAQMKKIVKALGGVLSTA
jgi:hypothetical protein